MYSENRKMIFMYLNKILGSKTRVDILAFLANNSNGSFVESELALLAQHSFSELNRQMPVLVNSGIVLMRKSGKSKIYSINKAHFLFKALNFLFSDLNLILRKAAEKAVKFLLKNHKQDVFCVLLVGSVASKTVRQDIESNPSDVDVVIVFKHGSFLKAKREFLNFTNNDLFNSFGVLVRPVFFSLKEFKSKLKGGNSFVLNALSKGVLLHGRKPRQFS